MSDINFKRPIVKMIEDYNTKKSLGKASISKLVDDITFTIDKSDDAVENIVMSTKISHIEQDIIKRQSDLDIMQALVDECAVL